MRNLDTCAPQQLATCRRRINLYNTAVRTSNLVRDVHTATVQAGLFRYDFQRCCQNSNRLP